MPKKSTIEKLDINLFKNFLKPKEGEESEELILSKPKTKVKFIYSNRAKTEFMANKDYELAILIQGSARLETNEGLIIDMKAGDTLKISPKIKHKILITSEDAIWIALHY
ncbi:cupin domain-containing protein [Mycoplasmopsis opalescens]|uniref:hypothetical protein n=1 Tax=Mycoplasmopsis opalescens TaxID=114886 RepID=UPI0012EC4C4F|nr:hypothetical protein [Mycoplasmopsis opalescens]